MLLGCIEWQPKLSLNGICMIKIYTQVKMVSIRKKTKDVSCTERGLGCKYVSIIPFVKKKPFHVLIQFTDIPMSWEARISKKHETGLNFEMISIGKHRQHHATFTALEALICTGRIAERTASSYMLLLLESILFGPELLSSRFFKYIYVHVYEWSISK